MREVSTRYVAHINNFETFDLFSIFKKLFILHYSTFEHFLFYERKEEESFKVSKHKGCTNKEKYLFRKQKIFTNCEKICQILIRSKQFFLKFNHIIGGSI